MVASLVEMNWHVFLIFRLIFYHICSNFIETFQKRAVNDELNRYIERLTNASMMFSQRSTSLKKNITLFINNIKISITYGC